jgi:hypothetical protein
MGDDTILLIGIISFLLLVGAAIPAINYAFGAGTMSNSGNTSAVNASYSDFATGNSWVLITHVMDMLWGAISMLFWSFGAIPFWLDATLFMIIRIAAYLIIVKDYVIPVIPDWL